MSSGKIKKILNYAKQEFMVNQRYISCAHIPFSRMEDIDY